MYVWTFAKNNNSSTQCVYIYRERDRGEADWVPAMTGDLTLQTVNTLAYAMGAVAGKM